MKLNSNIYNAIAVIILTSVLSYSCQKENQPDGRGGPLVEKVTGTGTSGYADGPLDSAKFNTPNSIVIDGAGNLFITDRNNQKVRKISASGIVSTIAGSTFGFADGEGPTAQFRNPGGISMDGQGNLYIADWDNNRIRKITPDNFVSTYAGGNGRGDEDGDAISVAQFNTPKGSSMDATGNLFVAEQDNHAIRKITPAGMVSTIAGGNSGFENGIGMVARFNRPRDVVVDASGNLYVADAGNHSIRKITSNGTVSTLAGNGTLGFTDGDGAAARFENPKGLAVDKSGNIYVADYGNHSIRKITPAGNVTTVAGDGKRGSNERDGATPARFSNPRAIAIDAAGQYLYIADEGNHMIRKIKL